MARLDEVNLDEFDFDSPDAPGSTAGVRKMKKRKLIKSFGTLSEDAFVGRLSQVVTKMTGNTFLPEPWWSDPAETPTVASLTSALAAYEEAKDLAADGDKEKIAERTALRESITAELIELAEYVEFKAKGNVAILESSGFELTKTPASSGPDPLPAPQDLRLTRGELPGTLVARCKRLRAAASFQAEICTGDTGVETNWHFATSTSGCRRILLEDLTAGTLYHVRVRGLNKNGPGAWSDVASLRAD